MTNCRERKRRLSGPDMIYPCRLVSLSPGRGILRHVLSEGTDVARLRLTPGTVTYAFYWEARMYNLYWWLNPGLRTLGHYFNIADSTRLSRQEFFWRDLSVDILFTPKNPPQVLDGNEVPSDIEPGLRRRIEDATSEVLTDYRLIVEQVSQHLKDAGIAVENLI